MITKIIEKAPRKIRIEALQGNRTFEEVDKLDHIAEETWTALYKALKAGEHDCIYWDDAPVIAQSGSTSHLQHILTRSIKQDNTAQLTCIQIKDDEYIPLSDTQITDPADLLREIPNHTEVHIF